MILGPVHLVGLLREAKLAVQETPKQAIGASECCLGETYFASGDSRDEVDRRNSACEDEEETSLVFGLRLSGGAVELISDCSLERGVVDLVLEEEEFSVSAWQTIAGILP